MEAPSRWPGPGLLLPYCSANLGCGPCHQQPGCPIAFSSNVEKREWNARSFPLKLHPQSCICCSASIPRPWNIQTQGRLGDEINSKCPHVQLKFGGLLVVGRGWSSQTWTSHLPETWWLLMLLPRGWRRWIWSIEPSQRCVSGWSFSLLLCSIADWWCSETLSNHLPLKSCLRSWVWQDMIWLLCTKIFFQKKEAVVQLANRPLLALSKTPVCTNENIPKWC